MIFGFRAATIVSLQTTSTVWPSGLRMAERMALRPVTGERILEIGCCCDDAGTLAHFIQINAAAQSEVWVVDPNRGNRTAFHKHMVLAGLQLEVV